jgi:hypothetical protein
MQDRLLVVSVRRRPDGSTSRPDCDWTASLGDTGTGCILDDQDGTMVLQDNR